MDENVVKNLDLRVAEFLSEGIKLFLHLQDNSLSGKEYDDIKRLGFLLYEYSIGNDDAYKRVRGNKDKFNIEEIKLYNEMFRLLKKYFSKLYL